MTNGLFIYIREDYQRYCDKRSHFIWDDLLSFLVIIVYRYGHWCHCQKWKVLRLLCYIPFFPISCFLVPFSGIQLPKATKIGKGLRIYHFGTIIVNSAAIIGDHCSLRPGIVIGNLHDDFDVPIIGNNVNIGVGAKILGAIKIGDNVNIGANAVVLQDVPSNSTAVGIPARIIQKKLPLHS